MGRLLLGSAHAWRQTTIAPAAGRGFRQARAVAYRRPRRALGRPPASIAPSQTKPEAKGPNR